MDRRRPRCGPVAVADPALALEGLASGAAVEAWRRPAAWRALVHSLETSIGATLLALTAGGIVALIVTLTDIRARTAFVFLFVCR